MNQPLSDQLKFTKDPGPCFWESDLYSKSHFKSIKNTDFLYYDSSSLLKYFFFHWANRWVYRTSKGYLEPYKYHPLPISDQILFWEPIFSKHISDGIAKLELSETFRLKSDNKKTNRLFKSVFVKAMFLTFWKRVSLGLLGIIITNVLSMSIAILVEKLLKILNDKSFNFINTVLVLLTIVVCQIADGLFSENFNFYMYRSVCIVHYLFSMTIFKHGLCFRRKFVSNINGSNSLNVCNQVLHSCSPDSECSKNPLYCSALRHQTRDITPHIITMDFTDTYGISIFFYSLINIIEFLTNFIYGIYLLSLQVKVDIWVLYLVGLFFIFLMIVIEIIGCYTFGWILFNRDNKLCKLNGILQSLSIIKKMFMDDIAQNIITKCRNNELSLFFIRLFLLYSNVSFYATCINVSFYIMQSYFVKSVNNANIITDIDTAGFMTTFYIYMRIITSMFLIPISIKYIGTSYPSYRRLETFFKGCAPNFYISDNKYTGSTKTSLEITDTTNQIPNDVVVYYKDASFTWVNTRSDLLNKNYEPYLKNINFELKIGEMAIVTGSQGSGKSNFIKSMLGEMTLVGGSMAVVPLHTSMPIFYASQDIFLQQGTIRSNIVFGYKFDEHLYNSVLKAVELEYDISTWEKGDLRIISDNAPSLSGGQRVRMELARAVYAYLVFHKINKEYNNGKCSFLMCLDGSFQGLDPYVTKTIFNNLFNVKTGLLEKDDLSLVLTTSNQILDTCVESCDLNEFFNIPIYNIKNHSLKFYSNLHNFIRNKKVDNSDYSYLKSTNTGPYQMNYLSNDILSLCNSEANTRLGRMEVTKSLYSKSFQLFSTSQSTGVKFEPHLVYMKPAMAMFTISIILTMVLTVMDNVKLVLSSNLSDYITKNINDYKDAKVIDLSEIKSRSNFILKMIALLVSIIIIISFLSTVTFTISCITSSRKIHEYCINSIFKNSSSVVKIKKHINQVITYILCDIMMFDDSLSHEIYLIIKIFIITMIHLITLFYLIPISVPFILFTLILVFKPLFLRCLKSSKIIELCYLETVVQINRTFENVISGSSIFRSFKKEKELIKNQAEHNDYKARSTFAIFFILAWSSILFNWIFSATTFIILVMSIILDKFTKYKLKVGYFGLALSLCMNVIKSFTKFTSTFATVEIYMSSVDRFKYFIPPGQKLIFKNCVNTHKEYLVNPVNNGNKLDKSQLLRRRAIEFKNDNKKFYHLRRLFYHPKIHIVDVGSYLTPEHSGVELRDVCVYTSPDHNPDGMILKHFNVSSHRSEIIGMVGRTGAGKTTLLSVLQNVVENRTGQVLLDGKDLNDIPKDVLRQIIGVLPQLPFVFKGWTVRRFLDPRRLFTDDEINKALGQCGLLNFVNDLPGGNKLDTILVQEDVSLSYQQYKAKGDKNKNIASSSTDDKTDTLLTNTQLRTLSMARLVLYRNFFRLIIVDEPPEEDLMDETSARTDDLGVPIYELLQKFFSHCTTFVTAHDANVLKTCTSVWVIHEGRLVRTCKKSDIAANESIATIIEESLKYSK